MNDLMNQRQPDLLALRPYQTRGLIVVRGRFMATGLVDPSGVFNYVVEELHPNCDDIYTEDFYPRYTNDFNHASLYQGKLVGVFLTLEAALRYVYHMVPQPPSIWERLRVFFKGPKKAPAPRFVFERLGNEKGSDTWLLVYDAIGYEQAMILRSENVIELYDAARRGDRSRDYWDFTVPNDIAAGMGMPWLSRQVIEVPQEYFDSILIRLAVTCNYWFGYEAGARKKTAYRDKEVHIRG